MRGWLAIGMLVLGTNASAHADELRAKAQPCIKAAADAAWETLLKDQAKQGGKLAELRMMDKECRDELANVALPADVFVAAHYLHDADQCVLAVLVTGRRAPPASATPWSETTTHPIWFHPLTLAMENAMPVTWGSIWTRVRADKPKQASVNVWVMSRGGEAKLKSAVDRCPLEQQPSSCRRGSHLPKMKQPAVRKQRGL